MTLRAKLTLLFVAFGVLPLICVGILERTRTARSLEALVQARTAEIADRSSREIAARYAAAVSDARLFGENLETVRWLRQIREGDGQTGDGSGSSVPPPGGRGDSPTVVETEARTFLGTAWQHLGHTFVRLEIRDAEGRSQFVIGEPPAATLLPTTATIETEILDADGSCLGYVRAAVTMAALVEIETLDASFGRDGYQAVVSRASGALVVRMDAGTTRPTAPPFEGRSEADHFDSALDLNGFASSVRFEEGGRTMVGTLHAVPGAPWSVLAAASLDEFAGPFEAGQRQSLGLLLLIVTGVSVAFLLVLRRTTRSLEALTSAASDVGRGRWPRPDDLPGEGTDEVGRLAAAFRSMTSELQEMIERVERSRQLAVLGEFASRLTHEIRNPLTSVKLNLQRIQRRVRTHGEDRDRSIGPPLDIALREVRRLEALSGGVLGLARTARQGPEPMAVEPLVTEVTSTVRPEMELAEVSLALRFAPDVAGVRVDARGLREALLNLLLNAVEATPPGGRIEIGASLEPARTVETGAPSAGLALPRGADEPEPPNVLLDIADTGPGVDPALRDRIFDPFFTTREEGTGLGLAIALRAVEETGGTLVLHNERDHGDGSTGASFRIRIPALGGEPGEKEVHL